MLHEHMKGKGSKGFLSESSRGPDLDSGPGFKDGISPGAAPNTYLVYIFRFKGAEFLIKW